VKGGKEREGKRRGEKKEEKEFAGGNFSEEKFPPAPPLQKTFYDGAVGPDPVTQL